jgi:hypothetical protein
VQDGQVAFIAERASIGMLAFRAMSRHTRGDMYAEMACIPTAIDVQEKFPLEGPAPTKQELASIIEGHYFGEQKVSAKLLALHLERDLRPLYGTPGRSPEAEARPI